ncbi:glycoside hydrolase family 6 protein [Streptomyces sp. WMMC897]|uniref:glycoside hydrolase family 6 protein n=1 Tax=Streptomyces sp. WMMC897 TaxID=3014782 RepID=UPI0022B6697E|nr:glycoside hydrolase family 6 protein [Streptomyces sp. WMMC897]MCZ7416465.1 glycoside hydrolase family 6 protein [Streptomyces sp. WMMC897]
MSGRRLRALAALTLLATALGCSGQGAAAPADRPGSDGAGVASGSSPFWVDPDSDAARQVEEWERAGRGKDAEMLRRIAERPAAVWPTPEDPAARIGPAVAGAEATGTTAVLVAYNIPHRDCGQYSGGGAPDAAAYRAYLEKFAEAVGEHEAVVVLEPDAVAHIVDGCTPAVHHEERYTLLAEAVARLGQLPGTTVYLDAGNPGWITDPEKLVRPLRRAGIEAADGFALNVANFHRDEAVASYGRELSAALGGQHFVIDSSRNGNGPYTGGEEPWCNPPGRALGTPPTRDTDEPLLDAYLWVKRPGESDGECRGGPQAGRWWPEYALGLARNARG